MKGLILLCCGSRYWDDKRKIEKEFDKLEKKNYEIVLVIEGEADGADKLSRAVAESRGIAVCGFFANWTYYRKTAGPIRNSKQLQFGMAVAEGSDSTPGGAGYSVRRQPFKFLVLAFHHNIQKSTGTKNMVEQARKKGAEVKIVA